jgi:hypothetical protein
VTATRLTTRRTAVLTVEPVSEWGEFPMDMLVSERAVPFQETDARLIEEINRACSRAADFVFYPRRDGGGLPRVRLECFWREDTVMPTPNADRWRSFGWVIVGLE